LIKIFKNTPPKSKFILIKRYENVLFQQKYSIKLLEIFLKNFLKRNRGEKTSKKKKYKM
jgi:hypothetical protein